jgi:hypothetical protein
LVGTKHSITSQASRLLAAAAAGSSLDCAGVVGTIGVAVVMVLM